MLNKLKYKLHNSLGRWLLQPTLDTEQRKRPFNERAVEYSYALTHISKSCNGSILDVGTGRSCWPLLLITCGFETIALDQVDKYWGSMFNRHVKITVGDIVKPELNKKFQFITCISVLEHIPNHDGAIAGMTSLLEDNGRIVLSFPYNEKVYSPNIYKESEATYGKNAKYITQVYSRSQIDKWCIDNNLIIEDQKYFKGFTGVMWTYGERVMPVQETSVEDLHQLTCLVLKKK